MKKIAAKPHRKTQKGSALMAVVILIGVVTIIAASQLMRSNIMQQWASGNSESKLIANRADGAAVLISQKWAAYLDSKMLPASNGVPANTALNNENGNVGEIERFLPSVKALYPEAVIQMRCEDEDRGSRNCDMDRNKDPKRFDLTVMMKSKDKAEQVATRRVVFEVKRPIAAQYAYMVTNLDSDMRFLRTTNFVGPFGAIFQNVNGTNRLIFAPGVQVNFQNFITNTSNLPARMAVDPTADVSFGSVTTGVSFADFPSASRASVAAIENDAATLKNTVDAQEVRVTLNSDCTWKVEELRDSNNWGQIYRENAQ